NGFQYDGVIARDDYRIRNNHVFTGTDINAIRIHSFFEVGKNMNPADINTVAIIQADIPQGRMDDAYITEFKINAIVDDEHKGIHRTALPVVPFHFLSGLAGNFN